jgi:hypothetical protein
MDIGCGYSHKMEVSFLSYVGSIMHPGRSKFLLLQVSLLAQLFLNNIALYRLKLKETIDNVVYPVGENIIQEKQVACRRMMM